MIAIAPQGWGERYPQPAPTHMPSCSGPQPDDGPVEEGGRGFTAGRMMS